MSESPEGDTEMAVATIINNGSESIIKSPYNASLVSDIKALPGRKWNSDNKAWSVPGRFDAQVREIVRRYFQIEGEQSAVEYEEVRLVVCADNTSKRSYPHGVTIDGCDVVNMTYGSLVQKSNAFEILESKGGFLRGDSRHAFEVRYEIKVKVRKDAKIETYGRCGSGSFEIVEEPVVEAPKPARKPRAKKQLSPELLALQLPEGKKARLIGGKIVVR
jgi:hypothetical protein